MKRQAIVLPAAKRLVVQHLGARVVQVGTVNSLLYVGMGSGHGEPLDLLVPSAAPLRGGSDDSFIRSAAGQQVHASFDDRYVVCLETMTAMSRDATVQVRGYLVPKP